MRILVVDDDAQLAQSIQRVLREHEVMIETEAAKGAARVVSADLEGEPFELVLCDFGMPGMTGLEVFAKLRSHREPPMLILMSGYSDVIGAALVADAVLAKPFRAREVLDAVDRIKARRSRAATRRMRRMPQSTAEITFDGGGAPSVVSTHTH